MTARSPHGAEAKPPLRAAPGALLAGVTAVRGFLSHERSRLAWFLLGTISIVVGAAAAFLVVLLSFALPGVPSLVVGFAAGALVGSAVTITLASRYPVIRKAGAFAILLVPVLVILGPFLLIGAAVLLLLRTRGLDGTAGPVADPPPPVAPTRRATRRRS